MTFTLCSELAHLLRDNRRWLIGCRSLTEYPSTVGDARNHTVRIFGE